MAIDAVWRSNTRRSDPGGEWHRFFLQAAFPDAAVSHKGAPAGWASRTLQAPPTPTGGARVFPAALGEEGACCPVCRADGTANGEW